MIMYHQNPSLEFKTHVHFALKCLKLWKSKQNQQSLHNGIGRLNTTILFAQSQIFRAKKNRFCGTSALLTNKRSAYSKHAAYQDQNGYEEAFRFLYTFFESDIKSF